MQTAQNTILVTGGGSIGRGLAESFHRLGNQVIIAGRRREQLESVAAANPGMQLLTLDQSDAADIARFATEATQRHPELNILINNAGIQHSEDLTAGRVAEAEAMIITKRSDVLVGEPFADQSYDVALSRGERCPAASGAFAVVATALRVGDRFIHGQGGAAGPCGFKFLVAHRIPQRTHRGLVSGVVDLEADDASALPDGVCRAEEPGRCAVTAGFGRQTRQALKDVGNAKICLHVGGAAERVMGVAFGLCGLAQRDRDAGTCRQRL